MLLIINIYLTKLWFVTNRVHNMCTCIPIMPKWIGIIGYIFIATTFTSVCCISFFGASRISRFCNMIVSKLLHIVTFVGNLAVFASICGESHLGTGGVRYIFFEVMSCCVCKNSTTFRAKLGFRASCSFTRCMPFCGISFDTFCAAACTFELGYACTIAS